MRIFGCLHPLMGGADGQKREQTCILLSRVAAFLMSINPDRVSANGNETGAKYLAAKLNEWADALHDYEEIGIAINIKHSKIESTRLRDFLALCKEKRATDDASDRKVLNSVMQDMARRIGHPYQVEIE